VNLETLLKSICPLRVEGPVTAEVSGVVYDSRKVEPGHVFAALPGTNQDGTRFVAEALARGARAVLCERSRDELEGLPPPEAREKITCIQVRDARQSVAQMAAAYYGHPAQKLCVVGVTGTNGKTTVTYMIQSILKAVGEPTGLVGTIHYDIGDRRLEAQRTTPEAPELQSLLAQMVERGCRAAVMEVSSHALRQHRVSGVAFDAAVFTNLSGEHLDYHETIEAYFASKARLFDDLLQKDATRSRAIINVDDPWGAKLAAREHVKARAITFGVQEEGAVGVEEVSVTAGGSRFRVVTPWGDAYVRLKLLGRFNVSNAMAAIACCAALGISPRVAAAALSGMEAVPGRLEPLPNTRGVRVFVDYAHTDDALEHVLNAVREIARGRLIVVFGCGGDRDPGKRERMGRVAASLADWSVLTSDNPRSEAPAAIIEAIARGFGEQRCFDVVEDRKAAIARALALARRGDAVLIAGKGHEAYQEIGSARLPFDDRQVARGLLA